MTSYFQDFEFFQNLEMHMRVEFPPLCGRDHLAFRSYYAPVKVSASLTTIFHSRNFVGFFCKGGNCIAKIECKSDEIERKDCYMLHKNDECC